MFFIDFIDIIEIFRIRELIEFANSDFMKGIKRSFN